MCSCDECYEMRQPKTMKCPTCGKNTYVGQVKGISSVWLCSNCGEGVASAGGFPPACHNEKEYSLYIDRPEDNKKWIKLAGILNKNILDTRKEFDKDSTLEIHLRIDSCLKIYEALIEADISCVVDPMLLQDYSRILNCKYR